MSMRNYLSTAVIGILLIASTLGFAALYGAAVLLAGLPAIIALIIGLVGAVSSIAIGAAVIMRIHELKTEDENDYRNY